MRRVVILALALAVGLGAAASPFASSSPDGLERVAADHGFLERGRPAAVQDHAPAAGYAAPGVSDARIATGLAGFAGTLLVFGLATAAASLARGRGMAS